MTRKQKVGAIGMMIGAFIIAVAVSGQTDLVPVCVLLTGTAFGLWIGCSTTDDQR